MNKQAKYRAKFKQNFPTWQESMDIYKDIIKSYVPDKTVLAVGCGYNDFLKDAFSLASNTYGVDPDAEALAKNTFIKNKLVGFAEKLPLPDESIDIITAEWVLEHIQDEYKVLKEFHRVLKPGGVVIFLTPNKWNYNAFLIRLIPNKLHPLFTKLLYNRLTEDTYPTTYKLNSPSKIEKLFKQNGFKKERLIFNGDPSYISFGPITFRLAVLLEQLLDKVFPKGKVHIIGVYKRI